MPDSIDSPFTDEELTFFQGLTERGVRFVLVGLSAAVVQGADTTTQDLDVWFESLGDFGIGEAALQRVLTEEVQPSPRAVRGS